jgi:hypothetical protein
VQHADATAASFSGTESQAHSSTVAGDAIKGNTVWGESGTHLPGNGIFSGVPFVTAVSTQQVRGGYVEAGIGFGAFGGFQDALALIRHNRISD